MQIKYILLAIIVLVVGCQTQPIMPPGGAGMPDIPGMPSGGSGSQSPSSDGESSSGQSGESSGASGEIGGGAGTEGEGGNVGQFPSEDDSGQLEDELDKSVGGFDEVLNEEQQDISAVERNTEGFGSTSSGGSVGLGEQAAGSSEGMAGSNTGVSESESSVSSMSEEEISERTPGDIPGGFDDDIVSKQLREAALAEKDPKLRGLLWEEYRKYKGIR